MSVCPPVWQVALHRYRREPVGLALPTSFLPRLGDFLKRQFCNYSKYMLVLCTTNMICGCVLRQPEKRVCPEGNDFRAKLDVVEVTKEA